MAKMWLAEDMGAYKRALAAVIFEPMLKRGMEGEQSQQAVSESEKVEIKESLPLRTRYRKLLRKLTEQAYICNTRGCI